MSCYTYLFYLNDPRRWYSPNKKDILDGLDESEYYQHEPIIVPEVI